MAIVVLINPNQMKPAVAPLALEYLAESLKSTGQEPHILDLCFSEDWESDIVSWFRANSADLVGFTIRNTDDCYFASQDFFLPVYKRMIESIRKHTDAPIVLGGAGLSVAPEAALRMTGADYAVRGDGELVLPILAERVTHGAETTDIPGLVYRIGERLYSNPPVWTDLSEIPTLRRTWLDNRRYFEEGGQAGIETKRGCGMRCTYCADPASKGNSCRLRPPQYVVDEINALVQQGINCYHLCDAEFNIPYSHAEAVCHAIIDSGLASKIGWYTYASVTPFDDELARLMKRAGCLGIDFGTDSGNDQMLRSLGRHFTTQDVRRTAEICHRHKITFMYDLLLGGPGETRASIRQTIDLMKEISPSRVGVSLGVRIYAGTGIANLVLEEGFSETNPNLRGNIKGNESFLAPVYYLSAELGSDIDEYITELIADDPRFFHASRSQLDSNYNYNDNSILVQAIRSGMRGAYWDILRRIREGHS